MMPDDMRIAREANLAVPQLLRAALENSRSMPGSEAQARSIADFKDGVAAIASEVPPQALAFGIARYAAQIIDQLAVEANIDADEVLTRFHLSYLDTLE